MRRHTGLLSALVLLLILVVAASPWADRIGDSAIRERLAKVLGEGVVLLTGGQASAAAARTNTLIDGGPDDWRSSGISSRAPRRIEKEPSPPASATAKLAQDRRLPEFRFEQDGPLATIDAGASRSNNPTEAPSPLVPTHTLTVLPAKPTPTAIAPTPRKTPAPSIPTPTQVPPPAGGALSRHIGLQAGHWKYKEASPPLNTMTGTSGGGKTEPEVTLAIATEVARILRNWGHRVDVLPTTIPRGYKADLFVSIHADGSTNLNARGFFTDRPDGSPVAAEEAGLSAAIDGEYAQATGIPYVNRSTPASHYYYGYREVASSVPRVLIETGFLTNSIDREVLVGQPQKSAEGIAKGIARYLDR